MSKSSPPPSSHPDQHPYRIGIVASRYNADYTDALVAAAESELAQLVPQATIEVFRVPGAYEIPVAVEALCRRSSGRPDAVIALGVIIRGATAHADLIAQSITRQLHLTANAHLIPVIHEVLLVDSAEHARERTQGEKLNRGREAAQAAAEMLAVMPVLRHG